MDLLRVIVLNQVKEFISTWTVNILFFFLQVGYKME